MDLESEVKMFLEQVLHVSTVLWCFASARFWAPNLVKNVVYLGLSELNWQSRACSSHWDLANSPSLQWSEPSVRKASFLDDEQNALYSEEAMVEQFCTLFSSEDIMDYCDNNISTEKKRVFEAFIRRSIVCEELVQGYCKLLRKLGGRKLSKKWLIDEQERLIQ